MKKCKVCKVKFEPTYSTVQPTCSIKCAILFAKEQTKKKQANKITQINKEVKVLKEKLKTKSDYEKELQKEVNTFIRLRDKYKSCISCDKPLITKYDAGHFYPAGSYKNLRFNEDNIHAQCVHCNRDRHGNLLEYRPRLITRIGIERVEHLDKLKNEPAHLTIPELIIMKQEYKEKIRQLKK